MRKLQMITTQRGIAGIADPKIKNIFSYLLILTMLISSCKKEITSATVSPINKYSGVASNRNSITATAITPEKTIQFSGYTWVVRPSTSSAGPGPNSWSADNAWVDPQGRLHLRLAKDLVTGTWTCAEVYTKNTFGYGKYQFQVDGRVDLLDKNVVFGLFNYSGNDGFDEMDIEFSRWGSDLHPILNYTVWPRTRSNGLTWTKSSNFSMTGRYSTHRFTRTRSAVKFQSLHGFQNDNTGEFYSAICADGSIVSTLQMPVYINLWLFRGVAPSDNLPVELVINSFTFTK